jgi:hypothetical protein
MDADADEAITLTAAPVEYQDKSSYDVGRNSTTITMMPTIYLPVVSKQ